MGQITGANYLLLGSSRSGKSWYAFWQLFRKQPPAVFIDPKNTDDYLREAAVQADTDGFYSVDWLKNREPVPYYILKGNPRYDLDSEVEKLLDWIIDIRVKKPNAPPVLVVVDEAGRFMVKQKNYIGPLQRLICEGKGYGVSTVLIAQHPSYVPNDLIQNVDYLFVWPQVDKEGICHGLTPITVEYWERYTHRELPEMARKWTQTKYHGIMTDNTETYLIRPDGSLVRPTGQEVDHEHEEAGAEASVLSEPGAQQQAEQGSEGIQAERAGGAGARPEAAGKGAVTPPQ